MTIETRIADSIAAIGTCRTMADLRDVCVNVYDHWHGAVPQPVVDARKRQEQLIRRMQ